MENQDGRRPLKIRDAGIAQSIARWISDKNVTPNQISLMSVVFAALAGLALILLPASGKLLAVVLPLLAAFFIQCRLLCNLFDGMVAVEGGKGSASGELFNDIPDRVADPLILIAAGYAVVVVGWGAELGWAAGLLAVMTAYVRNLAAAIGAPTSFAGPMAKQHRMALLTLALVLTSFEQYFWPQGYILLGALIIVVLGAVITIWRRARAAYLYLET